MKIFLPFSVNTKKTHYEMIQSFFSYLDFTLQFNFSYLYITDHGRNVGVDLDQRK